MGKNISGILDLSRFTCLETLDCNSNSITTIINLSSSIKILNCSWNKLTTLENLQLNSLISLNCGSN